MKKIIIAIIIAAAVAVGVALYYVMRSADDAAMARQALMGDGAVTCSFVDSETEEAGTFYVRDGDVRISSQFDSESGQTDEGHMLIKDDVTYVWSTAEEQGIRFSQEDSQEVPFLNYEDEEEFDREFKEQQASCEKGADSQLFELPDDIEFVDINTFFEGQAEQMGENGQDEELEIPLDQ